MQAPDTVMDDQPFPDGTRGAGAVFVALATDLTPRDDAAPDGDVRLADELRQAERRDLARELHDTVIQPLTALSMSFDSLRRQPLSEGMMESYLGAWMELTQEALNSLRSALTGLRVHPHAQLGLPSALRRYLAPQARALGLRLAIECHRWPTTLPLDWTSTLYLVAREALTNVEKHAHASEVTALLSATAEHLHIVITDNGVGIASSDVALDHGATEGETSGARPGAGFGLPGMRDRVAALGGRLTLITAPGGGVQLDIQIPLPAEQPTFQVEAVTRTVSAQLH